MIACGHCLLVGSMLLNAGFVVYFALKNLFGKKPDCGQGCQCGDKEGEDM